MKDFGVGNRMAKATASVKRFLLVETRVYIIQIIHSTSAFIYDSCYILDIMELLFIGKFSISYDTSRSTRLDEFRLYWNNHRLSSKEEGSPKRNISTTYMACSRKCSCFLHEIAQLPWIWIWCMNFERNLVGMMLATLHSGLSMTSFRRRRMMHSVVLAFLTGSASSQNSLVKRKWQTLQGNTGSKCSKKT